MPKCADGLPGCSRAADHTSRNKVITRLVQGSRLIPVLAQTPGCYFSNTKGSVQRPELNLWFSLVKVQLAEAYSQYGVRTFWCTYELT